MATYKISGKFEGKVKEVGGVDTADNKVINIEEGDVKGEDNSVIRVGKGNVVGGNHSVVKIYWGDATGGDDSVVETYDGDATGGDYSTVRTFVGDATSGDEGLVVGSDTITIGKNSVGVRIDKWGDIVKVIINTDNKDLEIRVENKDKVIDKKE